MNNLGSRWFGARPSSPLHSARRRSGKILVMSAVLLPIVVGIVGMVVDSGMLLISHESGQNVAAAAATAAALDLLRGESVPQAVATARAYVQQHNSLAAARVRVQIPPLEGAYAGNPDYVEVVVTQPVQTRLVHVLGGRSRRTVRSRAVAGFEATTADSAIVVLASQPEGRVAGLDIVGRGVIRVDGAVLVNSTWGAVDERGNPAGSGPLAPYGVRCRGSYLVAADIRVAGGVDDPRHYPRSSLKANRLPVPDPLRHLEDPLFGVPQDQSGPPIDTGPIGKAAGTSRQNRILHPGEYDWIENTEADITFRPGIYRLRGVHPRTGLALNLQAGTVNAEGVLFVIADPTDSITSSGSEDLDGPLTAGLVGLDEDAWETPFGEPMQMPTVGPLRQYSVQFNLDANSRLSPLENASSPLDGMLLYQTRSDGRTIVIRKQRRAALAGSIYARQGHVLLDLRGICNASFVTGSMRIIPRGYCLLRPTKHFAPAEDVFLVE